MIQFVKDASVKIFNQIGILEFRNTCTLQVQWGILSDQFGFNMTDAQKKKQIDNAIQDGSLSRTFGAYFANIYPFVCKEIEDITGFKFVAKKAGIGTSNFLGLSNNGYSFGLWNKRPSATYLDRLKDDYELSKLDINTIVAPSDSGIDHNTRWYNGMIVESLGVFKPVVCSLATLIYASRMGLFGYWAWYLEPVIETDFEKTVFYHLNEFKKHGKKHEKAQLEIMGKSSQFEKDAFSVANRIVTNIHTKSLTEIKQIKAKYDS